MDEMDQTPEFRPSPGRQPSTSGFQFCKVFFNQVELRAGWRLLIFSDILLLTPSRTFFFNGVQFPSSRANSYAGNARPAKKPAGEFQPGPFITNDGFSLILLLALSAFIAMLAHRQIGHYSLPPHPPFREHFSLG